MKKAVKLNDRAQYYKLAGEFHHALLLASANAILMRLYEQIRTQLTRYQAVMAAIPELPNRSISEHAQIVKAIKAGDAAAARGHAERHILGLVEQFERSKIDSDTWEDTPWKKPNRRSVG
jgi:DNA-binding GntR family transcriptional regulator